MLVEEKSVFDGGGGADEEAVPEEGHFFFERAFGADHAVDPPEFYFFKLGALGNLFELVDGLALGLREVAHHRGAIGGGTGGAGAAEFVVPGSRGPVRSPKAICGRSSGWD